MSAAEAAPYEALARNLERELELTGEVSFDELAAVQSERAALIDSLPAIPPAGARPALQRAALMNKRLEVEILRRREALLLEAANVELVDRTARGYAPPVEKRSQIQATA